MISAIASIATGTVTVSHSLGENSSTIVPATAIVRAQSTETAAEYPPYSNRSIIPVQDFVRGQPATITVFDETLVSRLIQHFSGQKA